MTARIAWRQAWREARRAVIDDEPPDIGSAYTWAAWLLVWSRGAEARQLCPADSRPWRLP